MEISVKYEGYIARQEEAVRKAQRMESKLLPENMDYGDIKGDFYGGAAETRPCQTTVSGTGQPHLRGFPGGYFCPDVILEQRQRRGGTKSE